MKKFLFLILAFTLGLNFLYARELTESERILKEAILYKIGENYIQKACWAGGKIIRWNKAYFPIKIYAENNINVPNYYAFAFIKAAQIWQNEMDGVIKITFVSDENQADIAFKVTKQKNFIRKVSETETQTLAYTEPVIKNGRLIKMNIYIHERNRNGKYYQPYEILNISIHEFGHALGIGEHPNDNNSVMYALYDPKNEKHSAFLNKKDKSTLYLLYKIAPDITNGDKTIEKGNLSADILIGSNNERLDDSIKNTIEEIKIKSTDCGTYLKLAALYEQKGNYSKMYEIVKMAEPLAKTTDELYAVHIGYASYFYYHKNKQMAKAHILKALEAKDNITARGFLKEIEKL